MSRETQFINKMAKKKPSKKKVKITFNDEQFEAHCLDSVSADMRKWDIPWFVGVIGKPNSDDIKIMVAGKPANIDKSDNIIYMKSLMTVAIIALEQGLNDKKQGFDIIDT